MSSYLLSSILLPLLLISNSLLLLRFLLDHFLLFYMPCIFFFYFVSDIFYKWQNYKKDLLLPREQYALLLSGFNVWRSKAIWLQVQRSWPVLLQMASPYSMITNYGLLLLLCDYYGLPLCTGVTVLESLCFSADLSVF